MNTEARKELGRIVGEFLTVERQMTLAERSGRNFITEFLQKNDTPVEFKPSSYYEKRIAEGDKEALGEALMDESENVVFDRLSEEDPTDAIGCIKSIAWDKTVEDVVAVIYVVADAEEKSVHLGNIKGQSLVEVIRFIDAFA